ncbi:DUF2269 family protein [Ideonella azotifigens]|uniref:DUF2269 family protein n=1 Tax=Ideonella azotifigens TaxID=513160 RepID=UPI0035BF3ED0
MPCWATRPARRTNCWRAHGHEIPPVHEPLPGCPLALHWQQAKLWEWLGYPAFVAMLATFWLMVTKPGLW